MVHGCDWFPTLLAAAGAVAPPGRALDGVNMLPVLRGECGAAPTRRFWQWNRYEPVLTSNAAMRDGNWKLVRPVIDATFWTDPAEQILDTALRDAPWEPFDPIMGPCPEPELPEPAPPELYDIGADPREEHDLAGRHPDRVQRMLRELENWFEEVEAERRIAGPPFGSAEYL
jgi:arylsulfatase A